MGGKWRHDNGEEAGVVIEAIVKSEVALAFGSASFAQSQETREVGIGRERCGIEEEGEEGTRHQALGTRKRRRSGRVAGWQSGRVRRR